VQSVYQPFWQTAHFTIPGPGSTVNNVRFMLDFTAVGREQGDPRFSYSYRDQAASLCLRRDPADFIDLQYNAGHWKGEMRLVKGRTPNGEREYASFPIEL